MQILPLLLLASASVIESRSWEEARHLHQHYHKRQNADSLALDTSVIQEASFVDGSEATGSAAGQSKSATSRNNFVNNCVGKTLTNGLQILTGSCNGIPMGDIPAKTNMISSMITFPIAGSATIQSNEDFNVTVQVSNLVPGSFTNAVATYYAAPQFLEGGKIVGHTHITVQDMGESLNPKTPLDPTKFAFFKGINDPGDGNGLLSAVVSGGLPAGNYRVCTMTSASNHQPVLMPVAQRGTPDDCTKFTVVGTGTKKNDAANDGVKGIAAAALAASAVQAGGGFIVPPASTSATGVVKSDDGSGAISTVSSITSSVVIATSAPFSNSTTRRGGNGGGNGNGRPTRPAAPTKIGGGNSGTGGNNGGNNGGNGASSTSSAVVVKATPKSSSPAQAATTTAAGGNNTPTKVKTARPGRPTGKRIITIIKTFFIFRKSRGAACPAVQKSGNKFAVLDELFDDLAEAAAAACGHQFTACIQFKGQGFSEEICKTQKNECAAVATTQKATAATPATLTASVTIPIEAAQPTDIPGSVVAIETIAPTTTVAPALGGGNVDVTKSEAAAQPNSPQATATSVGGEQVQPTPAPSADDALCSISTGTVFVDVTRTISPSEVSSASATLIPTKAPFSNSTNPALRRFVR